MTIPLPFYQRVLGLAFLVLERQSRLSFLLLLFFDPAPPFKPPAPPPLSTACSGPLSSAPDWNEAYFCAHPVPMSEPSAVSCWVEPSLEWVPRAVGAGCGARCERSECGGKRHKWEQLLLHMNERCGHERRFLIPCPHVKSAHSAVTAALYTSPSTNITTSRSSW